MKRKENEAHGFDRANERVDRGAEEDEAKESEKRKSKIQHCLNAKVKKNINCRWGGKMAQRTVLAELPIHLLLFVRLSLMINHIDNVVGISFECRQFCLFRYLFVAVIRYTYTYIYTSLRVSRRMPASPHRHISPMDWGWCGFSESSMLQHTYTHTHTHRWMVYNSAVMFKMLGEMWRGSN